MVGAVMVVGFLAEVLAWRVVATWRRSVWVVMGATLGTLGAVVVVVRPPAWSTAVSPWAAATAGLAAGVVLYLATRVFVAVVSSWAVFRRQAVEIYARRGNLTLPTALVLGAAVVAVAEELFWRGMFQGRLTATTGRATGAVLTWAAYLVVNLASANLAVVAGAAVGGAAWGALALWTRGVLASLVCHGMWTALMMAFPVVRPTGVSP